MADLSRQEAIALVTKERERLLKTGGCLDYAKFNEWRRARDEAEAAAIARLTEAGALIRDDWRGTVLKFDGIRCTCTGGIAGALGNWLARAKREAGK